MTPEEWAGLRKQAGARADAAKADPAVARILLRLRETVAQATETAYAELAKIDLNAAGPFAEETGPGKRQPIRPQ